MPCPETAAVAAEAGAAAAAAAVAAEPATVQRQQSSKQQQNIESTDHFETQDSSCVDLQNSRARIPVV